MSSSKEQQCWGIYIISSYRMTGHWGLCQSGIFGSENLSANMIQNINLNLPELELASIIFPIGKVKVVYQFLF